MNWRSEIGLAFSAARFFLAAAFFFAAAAFSAAAFLAAAFFWRSATARRSCSREALRETLLSRRSCARRAVSAWVASARAASVDGDGTLTAATPVESDGSPMATLAPTEPSMATARAPPTTGRRTAARSAARLLVVADVVACAAVPCLGV
ncbi:hypothetical protein EXU32_02285 [Janibacter limosus]|uniref:Uncharacterized protein n=1 Tax=Janibacter limosus TaxID=53458 RepID=A0A4P6MTY4_9MICO|nr:hypothetical protein EXU32_02285 [Janibacter limosus]